MLLTALLLATSMLGVIGSRRSVTAFDESIATYESTNCQTPKNSWNLGETACAVATGSPSDRRITWVAPDGNTAQESASYSGTASDRYSIPTSGNFAQVGTWTVQTIDAMGAANTSAQFVVRDPNRANADLAIFKYGPFQVSPGNNLNYRIEIINHGPDDAQVVTLTDSTPGSTTFVSEAQNSGPTFTCVTPTAGSSSGVITCTIATLPVNQVAVFTMAFNVDAGTADGTVITNTASISSTTNDPQASNSTASTSATVTTVSNVCTLNCPSNVTQDNDPNQCSAVVNYSAPTASGSCGSDPIICNPPSGSTFPIGTTTVTCTTQSGGTCSFTVTVHDTRPPVQPTINCPPNQTVSEDSPGSGSATVNYPPPTTTGNCVTTTCSPPSGSTFSVGTTTVNCTATDSSNNTVSCSFTVTVTGGGGCLLTCPGDITQTASSGCSAVVSYSPPTTSGSCGTVTCTPASGSTFQVGTTTVTCSSDQGPSCTFTVTVNETTPPTITTCASNKTVTADANCEGAIPNLVGEVSATDNCTPTANLVTTQSPTAGTIVGIGTTTVTITVEDSSGNTATCTATVTVREDTPPVITNCPGPTSASADSNCKAPVPDVTTAVTATDNCTPSSSLTVTQNPAAGTLVGTGQTTITITVKDQSNNSATCTTTFTVSDTTPPTITCPANVVVQLPLNSTATSMVVNYPAVTATDNCGNPSVTSTPASGSTFPVGTTTVNATATDAANNGSSCTFTVTVLYNFTGFFSPVSNPPALNTVNAGRAIPVKFSLSGNKGLDIFAPGFPASGQITCDASAPPNEVTNTVTATSNSLSYDAGTDQYNFVWATDPAWAGTCRQLVVKLNDGSTNVANFKFR